jgi:hypothetical protein
METSSSCLQYSLPPSKPDEPLAAPSLIVRGVYEAGLPSMQSWAG